MTENQHYDTIILGAGPSGVSAGLYLVRANKKVLVIYSSTLGALKNATIIENYYGTGKVSGEKLYKTGVQNLIDFGVKLVDAKITQINNDYENNMFSVVAGGQEYKAKTIILALGKQINKSSEYKISATNKISYCATCDGFFYKKKKLAVIGSGEFAFGEYEHLKNVTSDITLFTNQKKECTEIQKLNNKISEQILEINNIDDKLEIITASQKFLFDGVFIAEGDFGTSNLANTLGVELNNGFIVINSKMQTNIQGVFACGDIIGAPFQVAKAVNDGMKAGLECISFLNKSDKKY